MVPFTEYGQTNGVQVSLQIDQHHRKRIPDLITHPTCRVRELHRSKNK